MTPPIDAARLPTGRLSEEDAGTSRREPPPTGATPAYLLGGSAIIGGIAGCVVGAGLGLAVIG
ncbi:MULTISPECIES: hypothetical protein [unclassified Streptomyces]|uniref:hypothetical protein n=1 Tax=unclassified Streptomyces TaxID=2593676 RepID=UPI0019045FC6|nr:hypothetical protein [Streptomyces sp. HSG2]